MFTDVLRKSQLLWNYSCPFYEDKFIYSWRQKTTLLGFDDSHNFLSNYKIKEQDYPNGGWRIFTEDANWFWKVLQKRSQSSKNNSKDLHKLVNHRSSDLMVAMHREQFLEASVFGSTWAEPLLKLKRIKNFCQYDNFEPLNFIW